MISIQVNLRTILKNVTTIKKFLCKGTKFCAVVKDNAYGFGLIRISQLLAPYVDCFAVGSIAEGITLRKAGIKQDILILGICTDILNTIKYNLIITIENTEQAITLKRHKLHPRIHLAVNTGMNRFGFSSIHDFRETICLLAHEQVEGIYTHLAYESDHQAAIKTALERFNKFVQICRKHFPNIIVHAGCSGVVNYPAAHFDMVRIGKALYGGVCETQTAFNITSKIVSIKKINAGTTVGYNGTYTTEKATVIGIVRGGYVNGIPTQFANKVKVLVGKQLCPIIGRICMDYFFIDVSQVTNPLTQTVTIVSTHPGQTLMDLSSQSQMITCDLLHQLTTSLN